MNSSNARTGQTMAANPDPYAESLGGVDSTPTPRTLIIDPRTMKIQNVIVGPSLMAIQAALDALIAKNTSRYEGFTTKFSGLNRY